MGFFLQVDFIIILFRKGYKSADCYKAVITAKSSLGLIGPCRADTGNFYSQCIVAFGKFRSDETDTLIFPFTIKIDQKRMYFFFLLIENIVEIL